MLYIMAYDTKIIMPYDTLSEFFDGLPDDSMSAEQKGLLISYGGNDTHRFVEEQTYLDADDLPEASGSESVKT